MSGMMLSDEEFESAKNAFLKLDTGKDGFLSLEEFKN